METFRADTFNACREKVTKALRRLKKKITVPAYHLEIGSRYTDEEERLSLSPIQITGKHTGNGRLLIRQGGEHRTIREESYGEDMVLRDLTEAEVLELKGLYIAREQAKRAWTDRLERLKLDVDDALAKAYGPEEK